MDNANGAEKLISSIIEDAEKQAAEIAAQAEADAAEVRRRLDEEREKLRDEYAEKAQAERAEIIRRAATNAELEGRKELLSRKRALIDKAYAQAYERLLAMKGGEREAVLKKLIEKECGVGETVVPSPADRELLSKLVASCKEKDLRLGEPDDSIEGGFTVVGANYVKNCSFTALIDQIKSETLEKVAGILFG